MKLGVRLWRYSRSGVGWLCLPGSPHPVQRSTIRSLEKAGLIEEDIDKSFERAGSGTDIVYKLIQK